MTRHKQVYTEVYQVTSLQWTHWNLSRESFYSAALFLSVTVHIVISVKHGGGGHSVNAFPVIIIIYFLKTFFFVLFYLKNTLSSRDPEG